MRPTVLVLLKHYEPTFRFGGPIRSVAALVDALCEEFEFKILCLNHEFRDTTPLEGIEKGRWYEHNGASVCYISASLARPFNFVRALISTDFDVLYLNSFFDPLFSILPALLMKLCIVRQKPMIIAPRGELSLGALGLKKFKKSLFIAVAKCVRLHAGAIFQATSEPEIEDIRKVVGPHPSVILAQNLSLSDRSPSGGRAAKRAGSLNIVFLSRISPKKKSAQFDWSLRGAQRRGDSRHLGSCGRR